MYYLSSLLVVVPAGRLMDRIGRPPVIALGHGTGAAGAAAVAGGLEAVREPALAVPTFLAGLFLLSAGSSVALLTRVAVADLYPPATRGRGVGWVLLLSFVGSGVGMGAFLVLAAGGTVPVAAGYLTMVPIFLAGVVAMLLARPAPGALSRGPGSSSTRWSLLSRPGVRWTIASNAGAQGGMGGVMSFASASLAPLGGPTAGALLLAHFGGMFLPSPLSGHIADRRSRALGILMGGGMLALGALLFVRTDVPALAGVGLFLVGVGWCFTFIPGTAILADATTFAEPGTLFGGNDAVVALFGGAVVLLAGFIFASFGVPGVGAFGAMCAVLPIVAGWVLRSRAVTPG